MRKFKGISNKIITVKESNKTDAEKEVTKLLDVGYTITNCFGNNILMQRDYRTIEDYYDKEFLNLWITKENGLKKLDYNPFSKESLEVLQKSIIWTPLKLLSGGLNIKSYDGNELPDFVKKEIRLFLDYYKLGEEILEE